MQIIRGIKQGTPEWDELRIGILTMSKWSPLFVSGKCPITGFGEGALKLMSVIGSERITGNREGDWKGNASTDRGNELEPKAVEMYLQRYPAETEQVTIILNHGCGFSPDLLVGQEGAVEIKTKLASLQWQLILSNEIPQEHYHQCMGGLWVSDREWLDFVSYSKGMPLFVKRLYRDEAQFKIYEDTVDRFYWHMEKQMEKVLNVNLTK